MIAEQTIPCPTCQSKIPFDPVELIRGHKFTCATCASVVGIAKDDLAKAGEAYQKYETLKKSLKKKK